MLLPLHVLSRVLLSIHHHLRSLPMVLIVLEISNVLACVCEYDLPLPMHLSIIEIADVLSS